MQEPGSPDDRPKTSNEHGAETQNLLDFKAAMTYEPGMITSFGHVYDEKKLHRVQKKAKKISNNEGKTVYSEPVKAAAEFVEFVGSLPNNKRSQSQTQGKMTEYFDTTSIEDVVEANLKAIAKGLAQTYEAQTYEDINTQVEMDERVYNKLHEQVPYNNVEEEYETLINDADDNIQIETQKRIIDTIKGELQEYEDNEESQNWMENFSTTSSKALTLPPSEACLQIAKIINIDELIGSDSTKRPQIYSNIFNHVCRLRSKPEDWRVSGASARSASANGIAEKTQFVHIWGNTVSNYAQGITDDGGAEGEEICCYICQQPLVSSINQYGDPARVCSEMEHKYPCVSAFTRAPTYFILKKYKYKDKKYLDAWQNFIKRKDIILILKQLYYYINCGIIYDYSLVNSIITSLYIRFLSYIGINSHTEKKELAIFDWCFEVITYWLHEFAYAHHICNQAKSNDEVALSKRDVHTYFTTLKKNWKEMKPNGTPATQENIVIYGTHLDLFAEDTRDHDHTERKRRIDTYFNKTNTIALKKRLLDKFSVMGRIIGNIQRKYAAITSLTMDDVEFPTQEELRDIQRVYTIKSLIIQYRGYKQKKASQQKPRKSKSKTKTKTKSKKGGRKTRKKNRK